MAHCILLRSPAKINMGLRVLGRRPDGYHELDTIMVPINVFDELEIKTTDSSIRIDCPNHPEISGENNLAWQAADTFLKSKNYAKGVEIRIVKHIPIQAGLGGGSSNAAYTLLALRHLLDPEKPMQALFRMASQLGADVPFFLQECTCRARGIGHRLEPIHNLPPFWAVLACAPFGLKTRDVFKNLNYSLTLEKISDTDQNPFSFVNLHEFATKLYNDLQPVAERLQPGIRRVREAVVRSGAVAALMTGSGPTVFGLFQSREQAMRALAKIEKESAWKCLIAREIKRKKENATE